MPFTQTPLSGSFPFLRKTKFLWTRKAVSSQTGPKKMNLADDTCSKLSAHDQFLNLASHELKTPLTPLRLQFQSVKSMANQGRLGSFSTDQLLKLVETADRQLDRLSNLVEVLIEASALRQRTPSISPVMCDLVTLVSEKVSVFSRRQNVEKGRIRLHAVGSVMGLWDQGRIEQAVDHLLMNAINYGDGKPVEVAVLKVAECAKIVVRDQGQGISKDDQDAIFECYERRVNPNQYSGLGLGLFISREIIRAHGGELKVDSVPGHGSTFTVDFNLPEVEKKMRRLLAHQDNVAIA